MVDRAIGIFDSGVGGLTVLREVKKLMPSENIIYFADTLHNPYGCKSKEILLDYSRRIIDFLISQGSKLIIIACNTVSANCYEQLKKEFDFPIIEIVESGAKAAASATQNKNIGLIATETTIESNMYDSYIKKFDGQVKIFKKACPLLVPLTEEGWIENQIAYDVTKIYLDEFAGKAIDTLILGCTHYPFFYGCIEKILPGVKIINPAESVAKLAKKYLQDKKILRSQDKASEVKFYTSDKLKKFERLCNRLLNKNYPSEMFFQKKLCD